MTQTNQAQIVASTLRSIDAGGFINAQLDKAATLMDSQHARILELEAELLTEKRHQRTRDVAAVRTLGALGFNWNGSEVWQAAPQAVQPAVQEGWQRVPIEPTREMLDAYVAADGRFHSGRTDWAVMLAAAPAHPAEGVPAQDMVSVKKEDANAFCRILTALGIEEEGDPVAEVQRLLAATQPAAQGQDAARYHWLREQHDKGDDSVTIFIGDEQHGPGHLDAQIDEAIAAQTKQGGA